MFITVQAPVTKAESDTGFPYVTEGIINAIQAKVVNAIQAEVVEELNLASVVILNVQRLAAE